MLRFSAISGVHGANHFVLRRAGASLQLLDSDTGALLRDVAFARTRAVTITGSSGRINNTLTLDFSGGSLALPGGISYSGGLGGYNVLAVRGGHFASEREIAHTPHSGVMVLDNTTVHYAQIAPINDTSPAANFTINATSAAETIHVVNGPVLGGTQTTQVSSATSTFELINFANKANVTINGNGGNDVFDLSSTIAAVAETSMTVTSGERESSTFNVVATPVPLSIVGGGIDTANIGSTGSAESISSSISISDPREFIAVNVDDSAGIESRFVTLGASDTISGLTQSTVTAQATDISSITLNGDSAGNTFVLTGPAGPAGHMMPVTVNTGTGVDSTFVQIVAAGTSVAIHGQSGSDGVAVSDAGSVQGINGPVSIDNTFAFTSLVVDDSNDATARTTSLTSDGTTDTISGLAPSNITATANDLTNFTLDGGSAGNTNTLDDFGTHGTLTLNTGTGSDTTNVAPTSNLGELNINGQSGADTVNLGSAGSVQHLAGAVSVTNGATTTLTLNDASDAIARAVTVGTTAISGLAPAQINYTGVPQLKIHGGSPGDTFAVSPSTTTTDEIVGGGPASPAPSGNILNMNLTGASTPALNGTPSAAGAQGTWTFSNRSPVNFSHMQSLSPTALSVGDAATTVGGSGSSSLLFAVSLLAPSAQPVSATYATADGTATAASGLYQPASGTVLFPAGATNETILVNALGVPTIRPPQTLVLTLIEPVNALLTRAVATGTITDSFLPTPPAGTGTPTPTQLTPIPPVAPVLTHLTQTRTSWREGKGLAVLSSNRKRIASAGTSFTFSLNEPASVALAFSQGVNGRKVHGRCVTRTKTNTKSRSCKRPVTQGTLKITAHAGVNHVSFQGRYSRTGTLKPGRYTLSATAMNSAGDRSHPSTLAFTIIK